MLRWPLREALLAFRELARQRALEAYRFELLLWGLTAPHTKRRQEAPKLPAILRERSDGDT